MGDLCKPNTQRLSPDTRTEGAPFAGAATGSTLASNRCSASAAGASLTSARIGRPGTGHMGTTQSKSPETGPESRFVPGHVRDGSCALEQERQIAATQGYDAVRWDHAASKASSWVSQANRKTESSTITAKELGEAVDSPRGKPGNVFDSAVHLTGGQCQVSH